MPNGEKPCQLEGRAQKAGSKNLLASVGGEPRVRNTRHTVAGLVEWKKQGLTDARILEHHPDLTQAELEATWAYYDAHREDIEQTLNEDVQA